MTNCLFDIIIDFEKSQGSYLFDKKTDKYFLDFFSMYSSLPLGYNHEIFDEEFDNKIKYLSRLKMSNNVFLSEELNSFQKKISRTLKNSNLHFCCTGALAVESAIKCGFEVSKNPNSLVVGVRNSFHGINSWGFITDSNMPAVINRVNNFPTNTWMNIDLSELPDYLKKNNTNISSCIIEPIQCTAGDIYLDIQILKDIEKICKMNNICFIVDEVQTGFGVSGDYWYSDIINLDPDILIFGKKSQISGISVNDKYSEALMSAYQKLEVTFDGDLVDAVRGEYIINAIENNKLLERVRENSTLFSKELSDYVENYRSIGHLIAFDFKSKLLRDQFVKTAYDNQLLVNPTSDVSVRLRPNLAITDDEIDDFITKFKSIIS